MKKIFILSFTLSFLVFFPELLFSAVSDLTAEGIVVSYDKKKVVLAQDNGKRIRVNRSSIPKHYKLKTGARVQAILDSKKLLKIIKEQEETKKGRVQ